MREKVLYIGQEVSLENASEVLVHMLGVEVSNTTIHREVECYGTKAEEWIEQIRLEERETKIQKHEVVYCEADASMILTREKRLEPKWLRDGLKWKPGRQWQSLRSKQLTGMTYAQSCKNLQ